ncbi:MAG TPA: alpha-L-fucosidase, partial [Chitinophagaceae bacterium]
AIPTTNESYGYHKFDSSHKPVSHFIRVLASAASRGGNLLMNIGPKGNGAFDDKDLTILNGVGKWMDKNGESFYGTDASPLPLQSCGVSTIKENKLYLHVFNWPVDGKLYVGGLLSQPKKAYLLTDISKTFPIISGSSADFYITVPNKAPDSINTVVVLEWEGKLVTHPSRLLAPNSTLDRLLAFDAQQNGKGFGYGDGKTNRYYIEGWKTKEQSLSWEFNTIRPGKYKIRIKYLAPAESAGGSYSLSFFTNSAETTKLESIRQYQVETDPKNTVVITRDLDIFQLSAASYILVIDPVSIPGTELMKLLEIQLIRVD